MRGGAKPYVIVEALVEVWEGDQRLGRVGEQAGGRFTAVALMAMAADRLLTGARKETTLGVFIGPERREAASPELRDLQCRRHGAEAVGDVQLADDQWRKAARAGASVLWPPGTGLGVGNESRPVGTQCSRNPASDRRSQARSGVRARRYGGEAVDGAYSYQSSYGFASRQIPRRSQGALFPRVVNPRYRIHGTMCNARIQSSKASKAIL
jgi:hypothetical protein